MKNKDLVSTGFHHQLRRTGFDMANQVSEWWIGGSSTGITYKAGISVKVIGFGHMHQKRGLETMWEVGGMKQEGIHLRRHYLQKKEHIDDAREGWNFSQERRCKTLVQVLDMMYVVFWGSKYMRGKVISIKKVDLGNWLFLKKKTNILWQDWVLITWQH